MKAAERDAALWAALSYVAGKEARRDELADGAVYECRLSIAGKVNGRVVGVPAKITLHVGHAFEKASSTGPKTEHLVACLLARLDERTRERILREMPEDFAAAGNVLPDVPASLLSASKGLLERLRVKTTTTQRGPVSGHYVLHNGAAGA